MSRSIMFRSGTAITALAFALVGCTAPLTPEADARIKAGIVCVADALGSVTALDAETIAVNAGLTILSNTVCRYALRMGVAKVVVTPAGTAPASVVTAPTAVETVTAPAVAQPVK